MSKKRYKKGLIDLEFLVNLIRGLIVLVVIFFLAAAIYNIFFQDNNEENVKSNFLGLIDTIQNLPPHFPILQYSIDLGDPEEYSIVNSMSAKNKINIEDQECINSDCLCLCEGKLDECETPIICKKVKSNVDNMVLSFSQYRWNKAPYVELYQKEYNEDKKKFFSLMIRRANEEVALCDAGPCRHGYCDCLAGLDEKQSLKTIENLNNAIQKCSLETHGLTDELNQEAINIYEGLELKPRIYYYPITSNYEIEENLIEVYELEQGIPKKIKTYALETSAGKFKWLESDGPYSHNLIEMFRLKLEEPEQHLIFCDQINDNLQTDYLMTIDSTYSVEAGYCMEFPSGENEENIPFWEDRIEKVNEMIEYADGEGRYNYELPYTDDEEEETNTDSTTQEDDYDSDYTDDAYVTEQLNNYIYEIRVDYNIKPYIQIKKGQETIISEIIANQEGPNTYILDDFDVRNINIFKVEEDGRYLLYFTPHIFIKDKSHSFVNLFSLTEEKIIEIYDEDDEINQGGKKIKLEILNNKIQESVKSNKLSCNEPVVNTLVASTKEKSKGWIIRIDEGIAYLEYNGPEKETIKLYKTIGQKKYPINIDCYVDHLGNYNSNIDQIIIGPQDKDLSIVKLESGELCLHKESTSFFKAK